MFSDISAKAQENFSGARLIRAFAQEEAEIASFETANLEYIAAASTSSASWPCSGPPSSSSSASRS